jgi:hypothetical protein
MRVNMHKISWDLRKNTEEADSSCFIINSTSTIKWGCSCREEQRCCDGNGNKERTRRPKAHELSRAISASDKFPTVRLRKKCTWNKIIEYYFHTWQKSLVQLTHVVRSGNIQEAASNASQVITSWRQWQQEERHSNLVRLTETVMLRLGLHH